METRSSFCDFINHTFFEQGAFLTDPETQNITFGRGGEIRKIFSTPEETCFYLKDFFADAYIGYFPSEVMTVSLKDVRSWLHQSPKSELAIKNSENEDQLYAEDFERLKKAFSETLKKVVLVSCEKFSVEKPSEAKELFFHQALNYGTGLPYGFWGNGYGVVGSSPEVLFSLNHSSLKTFALAGTATIDQGEQLLTSKKDRTEHDLVIQDISEKLKNFSEDLTISQTRLQPYKNMVHLKTDIECKLNAGVTPLELTSLLSPTAALGGYPKVAALEFLSQTKYAKRHPNRYFGSAMALHTDKKDFAIVMIRNIQWHGDVFSIESGGGVVAESLLESELKEIQLKRESIKGHYL